MLALSNHEKKGKHFILFEEDMTSIVYTVIIVMAISVKPTLNFKKKGDLQKERPSILDFFCVRMISEFVQIKGIVKNKCEE